MNTQNTQMHIRLWHRGFWMMAIANLLLSASVTILIPTMPLWMQYVEGLSVQETGLAMGAFGVGLFLLGGLCSFLVQHYRRNMVCVWSVVALAVTVVLPYYLHGVGLWPIVLLRLLQGASFGLAQIVLASTLIIDTSESLMRTEANHSAAWFGRLALSLGPLAGLLLYPQMGFGMVSLVSLGCLTITVVLILLVHFPFRVPTDHLHVWSLDRFFLTSGWPLFLNLLLVMVPIGMLLSLHLDAQFYALMMTGFLMALLAQRFVFRDADLKSEVVTGMLFVGASLLIMLFALQSPLLAPFLGLGLGLIGSRFLLLFIKLSHHCQRGTAQSSFILGWESGLALGLGIGFGLSEYLRDDMLLWSLTMVVIAMLLYLLYTHQWFMKHKNR